MDIMGRTLCYYVRGFEGWFYRSSNCSKQYIANCWGRGTSNVLFYIFL